MVNNSVMTSCHKPEPGRPGNVDQANCLKFYSTKFSFFVYQQLQPISADKTVKDVTGHAV